MDEKKKHIKHDAKDALCDRLKNYVAWSNNNILRFFSSISQKNKIRYILQNTHVFLLYFCKYVGKIRVA